MRYNPKLYWQNGWDIFDFLVTVVSAIPEIVDLSGQLTINRGKWVSAMDCRDNIYAFKNSGVCYYSPWYERLLLFLRSFRVIRILKAISRFRQIRLVVLALFKTLKTLASIVILLGIFWFIFSVMGVLLFSEMADEPRRHRWRRPDKYHAEDAPGPDLIWQYSFKTWHQSLLTLFIMFTNDHWYEMLKDISVCHSIAGPIYVIAWVIIAAFIFQNIILGFLNNNFAEIRETIGRNMSTMERLQNIIKAVNEFSKLEKEDEKDDERKSKKSKSGEASYGTDSVSTGSDIAPHQIPTLDVLNQRIPARDNAKRIATPQIRVGRTERRKTGASNYNQDSPQELSDVDENNDQAVTGDASTTKNNNRNNLADSDDLKRAQAIGDNFNDNNQDTIRAAYLNNNAQIITLTTPDKSNFNLGGKLSQPIRKSTKSPDRNTKNVVNQSQHGNLETLRPERSTWNTDKNLNEDAISASHGEDPSIKNDWDRHVVVNLMDFEEGGKETLWSRDTLFDYLRLMETLQENLGEREYIMQLIRLHMLEMAEPSKAKIHSSMQSLLQNLAVWTSFSLLC